MLFNEKLNNLMLLENISNIKLAHALNIDASLVSRWRNGSRTPKPNSEYFALLATFFAKGAVAKYQKIAIAELLEINSDIESLSVAALSSEIVKWMDKSNSIENAIFDNFIKNILSVESGTNWKFPQIDFSGPPDKRFFQGKEGIRQAILTLGTLITQNDLKGDILFFSDQPTTWLTEDKLFFQQFLSLLSRLPIDRNILMISPIGNDLPDIFHYLDVFIPFFRVANLMPYFCPRYKQNIFQHFIFIAPGVGAIFSQSMAGSSKMPITLYTDSKMLHTFTSEFYDFLEMCHPLFKIHGSENKLQVIEEMIELHQHNGNIFFKGNVLPQITMHPDLLEEIIDQANMSQEMKKAMKKAALHRNIQFLEHLKRNKQFLMLTPPNIDDIRNGKVPVFHSKAYFNCEIAYTLSSYLRHLNYLLSLIEEYPNLHICVTNQAWPDICILALEGNNVVVHKSKSPTLTMSSSHSRLVDLVYTYLENEYENLSVKERSRSFTTQNFRRLLELLQAEAKMKDIIEK